jgi:hypothetical protein
LFPAVQAALEPVLHPVVLSQANMGTLCQMRGRAELFRGVPASLFSSQRLQVLVAVVDRPTRPGQVLPGDVAALARAAVVVVKTRA